ncbi:MAG: RNA-directed DNA polymerase [Rhodospirillaceae bacterium]|nr:RNA-directed DNA polymerase [Rhodospirillaceae bacterium]
MPYSLSKPVFDWSGERAFIQPSFDAKELVNSHQAAAYNFVCQTDIARYYHSIYTHSIAWAIHGKSVAKANRSHALWGNTLDTLVRNAQDGQTIGIPVGPDTSRVIGEIVGASIDRQLKKRIRPEPGQIARFVDDYSIGCNTSEDANRILIHLRKAINEFELDINYQKTVISQSEIVSFSGWRHEVASYIPSITAEQQVFELFFYKLHDVSHREPSSNVLSYGIKRARSVFTQCDHWNLVESYLLTAYKANSTTLPAVVLVFLSRQATKNDLNLDKISQFVNSTIAMLLTQRKFGEASWILFLSIYLKVPVKAKNLGNAFLEPDPLLSVLLCHANQKRLVDGALNTKIWDSFKTSDGLRSSMWLYAYEANIRGWGVPKLTDYVATDPYFGPMKLKNVRFYDGDAPLEELDASLRHQKSIMKKRKAIVADFKEDFSIDIEEFDDDVDLTDEGYF